MKVTALVMAGGRGTRMGGLKEKPLIRLRGRTMLEHVVLALRQAITVERIVVAVSKHAVRTAKEARKLGLEVVETPGRGYVQDMRHAINTLKLKKTLVVSADLPLINGDLVDTIVESYQRAKSPALAVAVPLAAFIRLGVNPAYKLKVGGRYLAPSAINLLDGSMIDRSKIRQEFLVVEEAEELINVNTPDELRIAKKISKAALPSQGIGFSS